MPSYSCCLDTSCIQNTILHENEALYEKGAMAFSSSLLRGCDVITEKVY